MKNIILRYGLIAGAIAAVLMAVFTPLIGKQISYETGVVLGYLSMLLSLSTVFIAVKTYRDNYNEGKIKFGKAFLIGLFITLIAGTVYSISFRIYFYFNPEIMDFIKTYSIEELNKEMLPEAEKAVKLAELKEQMEMYSNPIIMFFIGLLAEYTPVGIVISLIAAAVLKKK